MNKIRRCVGIFAVVLPLLLVNSVVGAQASMTSNQQTAAVADQYYEIRSELVPDRCLDVESAGNGDGVAVIVVGCWGGANQKWRLQDAGNGYHEFHPLNSQRCLDVAGDGLQQGAPAMQWACWNGAKQHWRLEDAGNGYVEIKNQLTQRCLDIAGSGLDHGARAMIWDCWDGAKQHWKLVKVNA